jgi:uncharacterized protein
MIYKKYGNTGYNVSAAGFGGMRFDMKQPLDENAKLLPYAFDKGINFFDTAPGYCDDKSEEIFGLGLEQISAPREDYYVCTKLMPHKGTNMKDVRKSVETSLKRLKSDYIDFFYVWCVRSQKQFDEAMIPGGLYESLQTLKEEGLIHHITISTHLIGNRVSDILAAADFDGVLLGVNILNFPYRWDGVKYAHDKGLGVVAMNPVSGGLIPQNEERFAFLANEDETPTEAALRFVMSCPEITVALNGFTTKEHIDTAARVADNCKPFSKADLEAIKSHLSENLDGLCTMCGYCRQSCPKGILIPAYMQFFNEYLISEDKDANWKEKFDTCCQWGYLVERGAEASECIKCGKCEEVCTQHLPIIERLETMANW